MRNVFAFATLALLAAGPVFGQQDDGATEVEQPKVKYVYRAVDEITFDPTIIVGKDQQPSGRMITIRQGESFPSQIDERVHFKRDLAKSIRVNVKVAETETK